MQSAKTLYDSATRVYTCDGPTQGKKSNRRWQQRTLPSCKSASQPVIWRKIPNMYIVAHHDITNPEDFWTSAQKHLPRLPESGVKRMVSLLPNQNMDKCTCVWEADSIENLQAYLREKLGGASQQTLFQVNEAAAVGLEM